MDNRSKLLMTALELFSRRGYDGIGVQEIVDSAGITKPTLYHYFGSKEGLLTELLQEYSSRLYERLLPAADYQGDLPLTLDKVASAQFDFSRSNPDFCRMQLGLMFAPPESPAFKIASRFSEKIFAILESLFLRASRDHGNMKGRHKMYAVTFIGMINTYIFLQVTGQVEIHDQLRRQAVHQFMHGIFS
jgi:TetR/AcrR family transcriptional regulator